MKALLLAAVIGAIAQCASGTERSRTARAEFMRQHPCPSTGKTRGACPGYVVDHRHPLCAGGEDAPANMQWQTTEAAAVKDRFEWEQCRQLRRNN